MSKFDDFFETYSELDETERDKVEQDLRIQKMWREAMKDEVELTLKRRELMVKRRELAWKIAFGIAASLLAGLTLAWRMGWLK